LDISARGLAYQLLKSADGASTYSNIAIDNALKKNALSESDKGLLTVIVMGVTERRLTLDYIIDRFASAPEKIDAPTRVLLRMGIYQMVFLDKIPEYAAINETVELAPRRSRGFVNAILRSVQRSKHREGIESLFPSQKDGEAEYLSVKHSMPKDVCARFVEIYGAERTERIFDMFNKPPRMTLRINTQKISREQYAKLLDEKGICYRLSEKLDNALLLDNVSFPSLPGFDEGWFFVQDEASQLCVEVLDAHAGERVIDCCSCPGSKSFGLAINMDNKGEIYSFDLHKSKLSLIEKSAERLGIDIIKTGERDARKPDESLLGTADRVLCDVPCSGLGVMAKKPEIRYKDLSEFKRLPEIQYEILKSSARYVKVGGVLVYSTCTVLPEENRQNVTKFVSENPDFELTDFCVGKKESVGGMMSLAPDTDGTDGFFIAKMIRRA